MGFRFRRSVKLLPGVRVNLSGSGMSLSFGTRGLWYTLGKKGRRLTMGLPGTGLSYTSYVSHELPSSKYENNPALPVFDHPQQLSNGQLNPIVNRPTESISRLSTNELGPLIRSISSRWRMATLIVATGICFLVIGLIDIENFAPLLLLHGILFIPLAVWLDRYRRRVKISYEKSGPSAKVADALTEAFQDLCSSDFVWRVVAEGAASDRKRNSGATTLNQRDRIRLRLGRPLCFRTAGEFPKIELRQETLFFLPDAILIEANRSVAIVSYDDLKISHDRTQFVEEGEIPGDTQLLRYTWQYVNRNGERDQRFKDNIQLPVFLYGELQFRSDSGVNCKIQYSNFQAGERFARVIDVLQRFSNAFPDSIESVRQPKRIVSIAFFSAFALLTVAELSLLPAVHKKISSISAIESRSPTGGQSAMPLPRVDVKPSEQKPTVPKSSVSAPPKANAPLDLRPKL